VKDWTTPKSKELWDNRTKLIAEWIPAGATVLEFGCWTRHLETLIAPSCTYIPSDIYGRGPDTFICNLNAEHLPTFPTADIVVFGGVLEYVKDIPRLIAHLNCKTVLTSYVFQRQWPWGNRRAEFIGVFEKCGYTKRDEVAYDNNIPGGVIMRFER